MYVEIALDPATCERLVWTLIHFGWQGVALAGGLAVVHRWLRRGRATPQTRYLAGCCCLLLMAAAPVVTYVVLDGRFDDPGALVLPASLQRPGVGSPTETSKLASASA